MQAVFENSRVESFSSTFSPKDSFTMGQQHRPIFRKRSLADLPGNIRVPVFKKPDRLKSRLEASLAGLKELQTLREKHQVMVNQAKTYFQSPMANQSTDSKEAQQFPLKTDDETEKDVGSSTQSLSRLWQVTFGDSSPSSGSLTNSGVENPPVDTSLETTDDCCTKDEGPTESDADKTVEKGEDTVALAVSDFKTFETPPICNDEDPSEPSSESDGLVSKNVSRPRSMSMGHFQDPRKLQEVRDRSTPKTTRSSADDILSVNSGSNPRVRRKDSIFEGVDISQQGPNPVHAILMQYSPLSSTQSMPSVCGTLPRGRSALLSKSSSGLMTNSETSSSRDSVFSQADTVTSSTQTEIEQQSIVTQDVGTQKNDDCNSQTEDPDSHNPREFPVKAHSAETSSQSDFQYSSRVRRNVPNKGDAKLRTGQQKIMKDRDNLDSINTAGNRSTLECSGKVDNTEPHESCENVYETIPFSTSSKDLTCHSPSWREENSGSAQDGRSISFNGIPRSSSLSREQSPTMRSLPRGEHGSLANSLWRSGSLSRVPNQSSRMTQSSTNLTPKAMTLPKDASLLSVGKSSEKPPVGSGASFKRSVPSGLNFGKKVRRFGMPLDSKLIHNMLIRQDKFQPKPSDKGNTSYKRPSVVRTDLPKPVSTRGSGMVQGKENRHQPRCSMETSDDVYGMVRLLESDDKTDAAESDDEYGMAVLLDSSKTLTSTPLMPKKGQMSRAAKNSFVSDEGYCPSLQGSSPSVRRRVRHKISIRSDHTWISSDMEESDVCSGEISPYSITAPTTTRFSFNSFSTLGHRQSDSSDGNRIISSRARLSPDWETCSQRSASVSLLSLSTDVQESSL